ncbi:MAG: SsrA-binding protein, partial [Candidatus Puniceispirillum sp.]
MAKPAITTGRIAENRKARHEYEVEETIETGLILLGSEVKSLRNGRVSIAESYAGEDNGRLVLFNANIPVY